MSEGNWKKIVAYGFVIRVALILFVSLFENIQEGDLKITDIDYKVYSDAANYPNPYYRHTYRYTPFIAYMNKFNYSVHQSLGKILFSLWDVAAMIFLYLISSRFNNQKFKKTTLRNGLFLLKLYAFNPLFIYLTVRGSCQSIALALMYAFWYFLYGGEASGNQSPFQICTTNIKDTQPEAWKKYLAFLIYGIWVHVRVYPIIFLPLILMNFYNSNQQKRIATFIRQFVNLGLIAGGAFFLLGAFFYILYGQKFIEESYLYHLWRRDNRHSFSPFFYQIYLNYTQEADTISRSLVRVVPFLYILLSTSFRHVKGYSPFYLQFIITFGFVTFNKVITLQYYMWVLGAVLLALPQNTIITMQQHRRGLSLIIQYFFPIAIWIWLSIRLEKDGENSLHTIWIVCLFQVFFHLWVLYNFMVTMKRWNPQEQKKMKLKEAKDILSGQKRD